MFSCLCRGSFCIQTNLKRKQTKAFVCKKSELGYSRIAQVNDNCKYPSCPVIRATCASFHFNIFIPLCPLNSFSSLSPLCVNISVIYHTPVAYGLVHCGIRWVAGTSEGSVATILAATASLTHCDEALSEASIQCSRGNYGMQPRGKVDDTQHWSGAFWFQFNLLIQEG